MTVWGERYNALAQIAACRLFFIGGAPRYGTTWLQQMMDAHPAISCRGEDLFTTTLATPIDALMTERARRLADKNTTLFEYTDGYPLPHETDADMLLGTAIPKAWVTALFCK